MNPSLNHDHNHPRQHLSYATYVNFVQFMWVLAANLSHVIRRVNVFLCTNMAPTRLRIWESQVVC